ncbi:MAG TPA: pyruvate, phosphate dikinase [Candidatus Micrarchaeia archaeon]|nr:pyruvate, phosphate dikinase [Candidatus Micrarchaeia archaeon]
MAPKSAAPRAAATQQAKTGRVAATGRRPPGSRPGRRGRHWVWRFDEGDRTMRALLGGKGAGVAEMTRAGLPVPPGFTITTEACIAFLAAGDRFPPGLWEEVRHGLAWLETAAGRRFGDPDDPLLVSVRSGAAFSMPGMMDTVLNLGLTPLTLEGLARRTGDRRFALDAYRRFTQLFAKIVLGLDPEPFEEALAAAKRRAGAATDADLGVAPLTKLVAEMRQLVRSGTGAAFPDDPTVQLERAIAAVFRSWNTRRAVAYREYNHIPHTLGTAVNVQMMVFGNMGETSGTGVAFTRDPATGEPGVFGEYLLNAQGEDVVAGIRTPQPIATLQDQLPAVYREFETIAGRLESHYRDVQDMEFTIERGRLFMLQTRTAKRTAQAAVRIATDMLRDELISREEALLRVEPDQVDHLLHRTIDPAATVTVLATGLAASPGAATGAAVFDADRAEAMAKGGTPCILVRVETNPDDVHGMIAAEGVLTARGGRTSHAAVVARGMGKPCVSGTESLTVDLRRRQFLAGGVTVHEGDVFTIDGSTGQVIEGSVPMVEPQVSGDLRRLLRIADDVRRLGVFANADTPEDARRAREFGAKGVGLCRTEHMFMQQDRLPHVQAMILASSTEGRRQALAELLPFQRADFVGILEAMRGLPVIIRLIDPPLHEFLPNHDALLTEVAERRGRGEHGPKLMRAEKLLHAVEELREQNPMLGLRGCRLGLLFPEIIEMQARAIGEATCELRRRGVRAIPEIMVPLVGHVEELRRTRAVIETTLAAVGRERRARLAIKIGTMIEVPRAALTAGEVAEAAEFFSFGTNDLTQMTYGVSRDDAEGKFLAQYVRDGVLPENPFEHLDPDGVGRLMALAVAAGRATRPGLELGICGEHGGDAASIALCERIGLDYVSCSPFRVPAARLAAAQAVLTGERATTA